MRALQPGGEKLDVAFARTQNGRGGRMRIMMASALALVLGAALPAQTQDEKPVPNDSARVYVAGCTKGYIFTAGLPAGDRGSSVVPLNTHIRMAGPKKLIDEIRAREGGRIELTGLMKKGQSTGGVRLGGGRITIGGGAAGPGPGGGAGSGGSQLVIDVEGWRSVVGECPQ